MPAIEHHRELQAVAKAVLAEIAESITPDDTERTIANRATRLMGSRGVLETWYYSCPALVLLGSRSCESPSGRDYAPSGERVGELNLVTVDLSPLRNGIWGDCARSIFIEGGRWMPKPHLTLFREGMEAQQHLHDSMMQYATPERTYHELYGFATQQLELMGYENLDFGGNFGHSIQTSLHERCYIQSGNKRLLGVPSLFTFEPHIRKKGGYWGFKHENIYYFDSEGQAVEL